MNTCEIGAMLAQRSASRTPPSGNARRPGEPYRYADSFSNDVAVATVSPQALDVTFIVVNDIVTRYDVNNLERLRFRVRAGSSRIERA